MQTASVQQTETTALDDIQRMKDWLDRAQDHANRQARCLLNSQSQTFWEWWVFQMAVTWQGGLDLQYLSSRFQRGKIWVKEFKQSHNYFEVNDVGGLAPAHQELLKFQTGQGDDGDAFLDHFISCVFGIGCSLVNGETLTTKRSCFITLSLSKVHIDHHRCFPVAFTLLGQFQCKLGPGWRQNATTDYFCSHDLNLVALGGAFCSHVGLLSLFSQVHKRSTKRAKQRGAFA